MNSILEVRDLTKHFKAGGKQIVHAVDGVSFSLEKGKTLGIVGESGCGKSSCARTIIRMYDPTAGQIILDGDDITNLQSEAVKALPAENADDLPGSVRVPQCQNDCAGHHRRAAHRPRRGQQQGTGQRHRLSHAGAGGPDQGACQPVRP